MNKRIKKKHNKTKIEEKIKCLKEAYIPSMFQTLMEYSDEKQRWDYHAARKAACIFSKNFVKKLRKEKVTTNSDEWICRYLNYAIIVLQNAGTLVFKKHKIDRVLFDTYKVQIYKPMTDEELNDCRKFFGSSFVDKVTQDEHPVFNAMNDHSKRREELRAKLPRMEPFFDAWDREREWLNSNTKPAESNVKTLYAEGYEVEDAVVISESAAKALCDKVGDTIRGHRLPDGWYDDYADRVAQNIPKFDECLDGTVDGLEKYHAAVAGNDIGFAPRMEIDKDGNPRLISVDLCRKSDDNESPVS